MEKKTPIKPVSPVAMSRARWVFWLLMLSVPIIGFGFWYPGYAVFVVAAHFFYKFYMKPRGISPYSDAFLSWWKQTWVYEIFYLPTIDKSNVGHKFCGVIMGDQKCIKGYLIFGCGLVAVGCIFLIVMPLDDLNRKHGMNSVTKYQAIFEKSTELPNNNYCSPYLLTFRLSDNSLLQLWWHGADRNLVGILDKNKDEKEVYELWARPNTFEIYPQCRKLQSLIQLKGKTYAFLYDRKLAGQRGKLAHKVYGAASIFFICSGLLLISRVGWAGIKRKRRIG